MKAFNPKRLKAFVYRDDWIRTSDLSHPKRARYQAAPHPVTEISIYGIGGLVKCGAGARGRRLRTRARRGGRVACFEEDEEFAEVLAEMSEGVAAVFG